MEILGEPVIEIILNCNRLMHSLKTFALNNRKILIDALLVAYFGIVCETEVAILLELSSE